MNVRLLLVSYLFVYYLIKQGSADRDVLWLKVLLFSCLLNVLSPNLGSCYYYILLRRETILV